MTRVGLAQVGPTSAAERDNTERGISFPRKGSRKKWIDCETYSRLPTAHYRVERVTVPGDER